MTLFHRRLIYIFFIIIFFTTAPILIFYTSGYRYNFKKMSIQKTGMIFIESEPKNNLQIYLNNNFIDDQTPLEIAGLMPDQYSLKIEKKGYASWQKKITIEENKTSLVQNIKLFKNNALSKIIFEGACISMISNSKNDKLIVTVTKNNQEKKINQLVLINLNDKLTKTVYSSENSWNKVQFVDDDSRLAVFLSDGNIAIVNLFNDDKKIINLQKQLLDLSPNNIKIISEDPNNLYFTTNNSIYYFDIIGSSAKNIFTSNHNIVDYYKFDNSLYLIDSGSLNQNIIRTINLLTREIKDLTVIDKNAVYRFYSVDQNLIILTDQMTKNIILFSQNNNQQKIINNVTVLSYDQKNNHFIWTDSEELWILNNKIWDKKPTLITRVGNEKIKETVYHPDGSHVIFIEGDSVKITENTNKEKNVVTLFKTNFIKNIVLDKKGEKMYFIGQFGDQQGVYEYLLQ